MKFKTNTVNTMFQSLLGQALSVLCIAGAVYSPAYADKSVQNIDYQTQVAQGEFYNHSVSNQAFELDTNRLPRVYSWGGNHYYHVIDRSIQPTAQYNQSNDVSMHQIFDVNHQGMPHIYMSEGQAYYRIRHLSALPLKGQATISGMNTVASVGGQASLPVATGFAVSHKAVYWGLGAVVLGLAAASHNNKTTSNH